MNSEKPRLPVKTKILNLFRRLFTIRFIEGFLLRFTIGYRPSSITFKLVPSNYLYPKPSIRKVTRDGINYHLDINDFVDWTIYYGFLDLGHETLYSLCSESSVVLDVGTNVGSVLMNIAKRSKEVHGFEPMTINYKRCLKNLSLNNFTNVKLNHHGLGKESKVEKIGTVDQTNLGMSRITCNSNVDSESIQIIPLDEYIESLKIGKVDLIKIDVEGYEYDVLIGAKATIENFRPDLFIEVNEKNLNDQNASISDIINYLRSFKYSIYDAVTKAKILNESDIKDDHSDLIASVESTNLHF